MALRMATPYRHPKTGTFWFRKAVPERLRAALGKKLHQETLNTKDPAEAKIRFLDVAARVEAHWAKLSSPDPRLSREQLLGLTREFYEWRVAKHKDDPGAASRWRAEIEKQRKRSEFRNGRPVRPAANLAIYLRDVRAFLDERKILIPEEDLFPLVQKAIRAGVWANETLANYAEDDYSEHPKASKLPKWKQPAMLQSKGGKAPLTLADFDSFAKESDLAAGTIKRWKPLLEKLSAHIGSADLAKTTADDVVAWKNGLLDAGVKQITIRDGYLAAARSFFGWAVANRRIEKNPLDGITVKVPKKAKLRPKSLSDDEANLILTESLRAPDNRASPEFNDAKRWVPWIMAYTGARVNEITQLRGQDIYCRKVGDDEVWIMRITPEAGNVKNREARDVPLHPHLVEQGLVDFVKRKGSGRLFYDPRRRRRGTELYPQNQKVGEKLAEWAREVGLDDPAVDPNHGWRHRFKTVAKSVRMDAEIRDAIQGHAPRTEGERYGETPIDAKWKEILLLPRYDVEPPVGPRPATKKAKEASRKRMATAKRARERAAA
jgi:integrase